MFILNPTDTIPSIMKVGLHPVNMEMPYIRQTSRSTFTPDLKIEYNRFHEYWLGLFSGTKL